MPDSATTCIREAEAKVLADTLRTNPTRAFDILLQAARDGQARARRMVAQMLLEGKGTSLNAEAATLWLALAANQGDAMSMNMLGRCHELGVGTPSNLERAADWYRRAADAGLDWGMYNHANLLATGRGVAQDVAKAVALYACAAALGHAKSMNLLARHLEDGLGTDADPQAALGWYRRSAESGDFRGQANYASILLQQGGVDEAVRWLKPALTNGSRAFLAHIMPVLAASPHAPVRALVAQQASLWNSACCCTFPTS